MNLLNLATAAAANAVDALRCNFLFDAGVKSSDAKDIKTQADIAAQSAIFLKLTSSGIPIISEENENKHVELRGPTWIVDPLDGTLNFSRGFPMACVSIALWDGESPILGVIADIYHGNIFSGFVGEAAYLDGKKISVSDLTDASQAVICTGFPSGRNYERESLLEFVEKVRRFKKVRMLGSAALMLAQVAAGRADFYEEEGIYLWDVAAGLALVRAAGGDFRMIPGNGDFKYHIQASNGHLSFS
jgi:myo-inositol-1(or 4)-monophosphatase